MARVSHKKVRQLLDENEAKSQTASFSLPGSLQVTLKISLRRRPDVISTTVVSTCIFTGIIRTPMWLVRTIP